MMGREELNTTADCLCSVASTEYLGSVGAHSTVGHGRSRLACGRFALFLDNYFFEIGHVSAGANVRYPLLASFP